MSKVLVELVGTFFLVLVIGLTVIMPGAGDLAPFAIGAILMVMVYAGGPISGAHYNPAVTLAVWLRGKCPTSDVAPYMFAQVIGAGFAAWAVGLLKVGSVVVPLQLDPARALAVELLFTFALATVVLNVATSRQAAGNSYFGLAIGMTVTAGAYAAGAISGAAFNPAVAIGAMLMGMIAVRDLWIYLLGCFAGAALAALFFRATHPKE